MLSMADMKIHDVDSVPHLMPPADLCYNQSGKLVSVHFPCAVLDFGISFQIKSERRCQSLFSNDCQRLIASFYDFLILCRVLYICCYSWYSLTHDETAKDYAITAEALQKGGEQAINAIYDFCSAVYISPPHQWITNVIVPLTKKGDLSPDDNGRSLTSVAAHAHSKPLLNQMRPVWYCDIDYCVICDNWINMKNLNNSLILKDRVAHPVWYFNSTACFNSTGSIHYTRGEVLSIIQTCLPDLHSYPPPPRKKS